jgi:hypothetical protein
MTQDYRWFSRNTDGGYLPDWALEAEEDDFPGWDEMEPTDITDRAIAWFKSQEK